MPLTVGQLTARLSLDKTGYKSGLDEAKDQAKKAGGEIADGIKAGTDRIPGLMSQAASGAIGQLDRLASEGRRATSVLSGPPQQLAALARASGLSVDELRTQLRGAQQSAKDLGVTLEDAGRRGGMSLRDLAATAKSVIPALGIGAILAKGFDRLESIDSAQAKLKALGNDAMAVKAIMNDALASVKGTAFGLDEAASVAATAVAAGIQPGQQLESTLKLIADAAAVAGTSMGVMGSIFNKVAANGKLQTQVMLQLQDQGIPVLVKLAEHYGITTEAAQKMVTQGKVSFADFAAVMQDTLGGAALGMGDTIKGTLDNTGAALSRLGAGILQNVVPALSSAADSVIFLADGFGKLPGPVKDATLTLGAMLALSKLGVFSGLASGASALVTQLRLIRTEGLAASGVLATVGKVGAIGVATVAVTGLVKAWNDYRATLLDVNTLVDQNTGLLNSQSDAMIRQALAKYTDQLNGAGISMDQMVAAIKSGGPAVDQLADKVRDQGNHIVRNLKTWGQVFSVGMWEADTNAAANQIINTARGIQDAQSSAAKQHEITAQSVGAVTDAYGKMNAVSDEYLRAHGLMTAAERVAADAAATAAAEQRAYAKAIGDTAVVTGSASTAMGQWIRANQQAADAARDAAAAADEANVAYNRSLVDLVGAQQDAATAMRDAGIAAKKTGDAVFDSSGNFDLAQKSVRDMVDSLSTYKDAAESSITATYRQTAASEGTVAAQAAAQSAAYGARQGFIDMATSIWGVSIPAAENIANQLGFLQGIRIDDKTFTVTMVRRTVDVAVANSALGDSWMRKINHDAETAAAAASEAFQPPTLPQLIGAIPAPKIPKSGGGGGSKGGKSQAQKDAEKAATDAKRAAEQAQKDAEKRAADAARREQDRLAAMAKTVAGTFDQIGRSVSKPFDLATMNLTGIVTQISASGRSLANAVAKGLDPKQAKPLEAQLLSLAKEAGKQFQAIQLKIRTTDFDNLRTAITGTVSDVQSAVKALQDDLRSVGAPSGVIAVITAQEDQLTAAMRQREQVVSRLADAQSALNNVLDQYNQRVASVTSSMQGFASLTNLVSGTEMSGFGADTLVTSLTERASAAQQFADNIAKLKAAGLNDTTLQQLIDAGPGSAANQVDALMSATSAQIKQINSLTDSVFGSGSKLGKLSAESMFRQGISAAQSMVDGLTSQRDSLTSTISHLADGIQILAQNDMKLQGQRAMDGLIDGLKSKDSALNKAMQGIGAGMLKTFKSALGIHSPSKVMAEQVGMPIVDGIIAGMNSRAASLDSTGIKIAGGLAGGAGSGSSLAGAQGPIELRLTIAGVDGPLADAIAKGARVEVVAANTAAQVRVNQGGSPWPA